jgi:acetylornithine deacetylase/succinyl-diaminopimelate desuccinylase-like protein
MYFHDYNRCYQTNDWSINMNPKWVFMCIFLLFLPSARGQADTNGIRQYRMQHEAAILQEFLSLLSIPNVASDSKNIEENAARILEMMRKRNLNPRLLISNEQGAPPVVYGEWNVPNATRTVLFYAHYDGQPADPSSWSVTPPWQPLIKAPDGSSFNGPLDRVNPESRIYARSASDDKACVMALLTAMEALQANHIAPTVKVKLFFEGEEEAGSPHLDEITKRYKELLSSDVWILCDGPVHHSGRKQIVFGVRGDTNVDITVFGPLRPLHSGHYGNWAPNPAMLLARLLASMKDDQGRVTVAGWYDDVEPLNPKELEALSKIPDAEPQLKQELGIAKPEGAGKSLLELINLPSLNINGMNSADVGEKARNVIPTAATATLDLRVVKGNDYKRQVAKLIKHIQAQGYFVIDREPTAEERNRHARIAKVIQASGGYNAYRTSMDLPISVAISKAIQSVVQEPLIQMPTLGGSLPLSIIADNLKVPMIIVPIVNYDNNQHAENENLRLQNLWDGIEIMAAIATMK